MTASEQQQQPSLNEFGACCQQCSKNFSVMLTDREYEHDRYMLDKTKFCSPKCSETFKTKEKFVFEKRMRDSREEKLKKIIPPKFQEIESDFKRIDDIMNKSFFIYGPCGTGKTVLLASMCRKFVRAGKDVQWLDFPSFVIQLQSMFHQEGRNPYGYAEQIASCSDALAIDDLAGEKASDFTRQLLFFILDKREKNNLRTLITSNRDIKYISENIDDRCASRIVGMCEIIHLTGRDRRVTKND